MCFHVYMYEPHNRGYNCDKCQKFISVKDTHNEPSRYQNYRYYSECIGGPLDGRLIAMPFNCFKFWTNVKGDAWIHFSSTPKNQRMYQYHQNGQGKFIFLRIDTGEV